ncbi:MAG TPA: GDSL-type esterase/lipase family protein [Polyangiales bacterium]
MTKAVDTSTARRFRRTGERLLCCVLLANCGETVHAPSRKSTLTSATDLHTPRTSEPAANTATASRGVTEASAAAATGDAGQSPPSATDATSPAALVHPIAIEDPTGHAFNSFHAALRAIRTERRKVRIVFYGASHVAADFYTDVIRSRLQAKFGDAGAGFVVPARPFGGYRNACIELEPAVGFRGVDVKAKAPAEDRYGLAGVYLRARQKPASAALATRPHDGLSGAASRFELYYLKQPRGGRVRVSIDGQLRRELSTSGRAPTAAYQTFDVSDGQHRFELATAGDGLVQIFGVAVERDAPGVVLDTLGIPGSRVAYQLLWDDAIYREHLTRRHPDLVALAYGTNESGDDEPIEQYTADMRRVVARVREVAPQASCLLIGPSDRPIAHDDGTWSERSRTAEIVNAQRAVAAEYGCGFFDLVAFMGGPSSMLRWMSSEPPLATADHVHFTRRGYEELGRVLYEALMAGYAPAAAEASEAVPDSASSHMVLDTVAPGSIAQP